jgi:hypothetical protein
MQYREMSARASPISSTEKTDHAKSRACSYEKYEEEAKLIERGLIITGGDAELLGRAPSEVKTKAYEESEAQLDDAQALDALLRVLGASEMPQMTGGKKKEVILILASCVSAWC